MKERDEKFFEIVNDFDVFMRKHGYYTVEKAADLKGMSYDCLFHRIVRNMYSYPDLLRINKNYYIYLPVVDGRDRRKTHPGHKKKEEKA